MAEIKNIKWNGCNVVSTFSGCGGSSLGYRMAGYKVLYANEFVKAARDSYNANKAPYTFLDERDIREVTGADILEKIGLGVGELDLLDGSPPCASFSMAGNREKDWGKVKKYSDKEQRTDDLFFEFVRILKEVQPKTFVAENVAGLAMGAAKELLGSHQMDMFGAQDNTILHKLMDCGYRVRAEVLNAAELGVPQSRRRLIFVGVRTDLGKDPVYPKPFAYKFTVRDAISDCVKVPEDVVAGIERFAIGEEWKKLKEDGKSEKYFSLYRSAWDKAVRTITATMGVASAASVTHPDECRKFTILETKRLCAFPDDFDLVGDYTKQIERLGRSVPPLMMKAISEALYFELLKIKQELQDDTRLPPCYRKEYDNVPEGGTSKKYISMARASFEKPCPTITTKKNNLCHPTEKRNFTLKELKRLSAFPDDFELKGSTRKKVERIGRSVPPLMMKAISEALYRGVIKVSLEKESPTRCNKRRLVPSR